MFGFGKSKEYNVRLSEYVKPEYKEEEIEDYIMRYHARKSGD